MECHEFLKNVTRRTVTVMQLWKVGWKYGDFFVCSAACFHFHEYLSLWGPSPTTACCAVLVGFWISITKDAYCPLVEK